MLDRVHGLRGWGAALLLLTAACGADDDGSADNGGIIDESGGNQGNGDGDNSDPGWPTGNGNGSGGNQGDGDGSFGDGDGDTLPPGDGDSGDGDVGDGDGDLIGDGDGDSTPAGSPFPSVTDFSTKGPFATTSGPQPDTCTIHRPSTLGEAGRKHPVILWGNGTGTMPVAYSLGLSHWASHGFIVAAANTTNAGSAKEMLACLDYLEAQNKDSNSPYFGKVDVKRVGASGHSQGGAGALMAGADARVSTTAPLQPYVAFALGGFSKNSISKQTGPMLLLSGSADTIATPAANQKPVYDGTNVPVVWGTLQGANHTTSAAGNMSGYRGPMTAWFRLHLMNDQSAKPLFYGASCGLCSDAQWTVERKQIN